MEVEYLRLPAQKVAYIRHYGEYGLEPTRRTLNRLLRWATSRKLEGQILGIPWNNPRVTPPHECCYDACITVPPDFEAKHPAVETQTLEAGTYLVRRCHSVQGDLETPWQEFLAWYHQSDWEMTDQPCFEIYTDQSYQDPSGNWSLELYLPVYPKQAFSDEFAQPHP